MINIRDKYGRILHVIYRQDDICEERTNLTNTTETLQVAAMKLPIKKFKAHYHLPTYKTTVGTQECWIVIRGSIKVFYFNTEHELIGSHILHSGDLTLTLRGGHNYEILEPDTLVYEVKSGPYLGIELDKDFIDD